MSKSPSDGVPRLAALLLLTALALAAPLAAPGAAAAAPPPRTAAVAVSTIDTTATVGAATVTTTTGGRAADPAHETSAAPRPTLAGSGTSPRLLSVAALSLTLITLGTIALVRSRRPRR
ncbi:hypothetical protein OG455_24330 [Kitasatospora sp. NBC_01287]|uniref:hypothetical protein n=1 Tax=Kitasatospora sp. NBC_01287 TaxID=2903573 RepID=UPI002250D5FF|nr:hypothetical protein [Kitasatospora sp. NBC_01287]MCX4748607.1 hypothetical protein [Kitasatospora sp. NBC_01287]